MFKKKFTVELELSDKDKTGNVPETNYGLIISNTLYDKLNRTELNEKFEGVKVTEYSNTFDEAILILLDKYRNFKDLSVDYFVVDYIPGKEKNEDKILKWCDESNRYLVEYATVRGDDVTVNVVVTSNWFKEIVSSFTNGFRYYSKKRGWGTITSEPFIQNKQLCVNATYISEDESCGCAGAFPCWEIISEMDGVDERVRKREYTFWDIVEEINWQWLINNDRDWPYADGKKKLIALGLTDYEISSFHDIAVSYRKILQNSIREYSMKEYGNRYQFISSMGVSDDSFWDLTAHIVGLGESVYNDILMHPEKIKDYAKNHKYKENFEYCFTCYVDNKDTCEKIDLIPKNILGKKWSSSVSDNN